MNTSAQDVFDSFESSFRERYVIPEAVERVWLKKAIARYSVELTPLTYIESDAEFDTELDQYVIDTLAAYMKQLYQEREVSRVNKEISIVGKDISIDGGGHLKTAARNELEYCSNQSDFMTFNQMPTAYN